MKFAIDYQLDLEDGPVKLSKLQDGAVVDAHRDDLENLAWVEGSAELTIASKSEDLEFSDPMLRFAYTWAKKVPWVIAGDTETVALRNSAHCFAFIPSGDGVELSFFSGDEAEIEEYVLEPTQVLLADFVEGSLEFGRKVSALVETIDAELFETNEDCKDLRAALEEAEKAWKEHLRQKR